MLKTDLMHCKVIVSGDVVEVYFYGTPIQCGESNKKTVSNSNREGEREEKRNDNLLRSRQTIRRIIWANQGQYTKFLTLTFRETILDVKRVRRCVTSFVQNLRRNGFEFKYLYVLEHQKKRGKREKNQGCLHVHMVVFVDKYIPYQSINKAWKHGQTDIKAIDDVKNLGAYVCKYITKENLAEFGKHTFACSLGLERPSAERFYTLGYSDSSTELTPDKVLSALNISFSGQIRHDFFDSYGETGEQVITYYQGTWKEESLFSPDPLIEFEKRLKNNEFS